MNLKKNKLSGFILQKDVYTTNILYENNLILNKNLKNIVPFRPKSGRVPQDPTKCLQILKQICPQTTRDLSVYLYKDFWKTKKLINKKLKFPLPKIRLRPISSNDFYKSIRGSHIRTKNIEDDLNITSNNGKKIHFYYTNTNNNRNKKYKEKSVNFGNGLYDNKRFDEFFDFGFHLHRDYDNFIFKNKRINSTTKLKIKVNNRTQKQIYPTDRTFKTQIDFNLLSSTKNKTNTSKFQEGQHNNNLFLMTN